MSNGFSQYQQSQLGVSAAKARAISEQSEAQFRTFLTALSEKEALARAADQLEKIAKEAEERARERGRRVSFGRLLGSVAGYAIGGPAGKAALGTALGSFAGQAAAGGFKSYGVDVPESLVPGGVFYARDREQLQERAEDLESAFEELTKQQRQNIGKNVLTDYLTGRGLGKLGEAKIGDLGVSLDELLETGQISKKEYLVDILRSAAGGIGEKRMGELAQLQGSALRNVTPTENFIKAAGTVDRLGMIPNTLGGQVSNVLDFSNIVPNTEPLNLLDSIINMDELNYLQNLNPNYKKRNSLFNYSITPMRYIGENL